MDKEFNQQLYGQFARIGKAVSNGHRISLLNLLGQAEHTVDELAKLSGLSVANTSQHLQQLRHTGLVDARKHGQHMHYRLTDEPGVLKLLGALQSLAQGQLTDFERLIRQQVQGGVEAVGTRELLARLSEHATVVLDVRPEDEFAAGHIPGARNREPEAIDPAKEKLSKDSEVIIYGRGPCCALAFEAVGRLQSLGYRAARLEQGFPEWKMAGLPVEPSKQPVQRAKQPAAA